MSSRIRAGTRLGGSNAAPASIASQLRARRSGCTYRGTDSDIPSSTMPAVVMASHPKRHVACIAAICDNSDDPAADRHHCEIHGCRYVDRLSQDRRPHQLYEVVEGVKPHQRAAEAAWWHVVRMPDDRRKQERSEERRVGKECVSTCISRWSRSHS